MIHPGYHPCQGGSATNVKLVKTANQNVRCTPRAMFSSRSQRSEKSNDSDAALSTATVSCPATDREGPWPNRYGSCTPPTATLKRSLIWCFEHQWNGNHGMLLMTSENTCERKLKDEHECGKFTIYIYSMYMFVYIYSMYMFVCKCLLCLFQCLYTYIYIYIPKGPFVWDF